MNIRRIKPIYDDMKEMQSVLNEELLNAQMEVLRKREVVIQDRLTNIGVDIDLQEESKRRFPRVIGESRGETVSYYWDDGTFGGRLLVEFTMEVNGGVIEDRYI